MTWYSLPGTAACNRAALGTAASKPPTTTNIGDVMRRTRSTSSSRDGNPLASFAFYDSDSKVVTIHRVPYRVERAQTKILQAGLPRPLADRLALGR